MTDWKKLLDINTWSGMTLPASEHAHEIDLLLLLVHWFMVILFVCWTAFFLRILWRFRRSNNPKADYVGFKGHHTTYAEIGVILIEAILLLALAFPLWAKRVNEFPPEKDAIEVRVIAEQFAWNIHYPGPDGQFGKRALNLVNPDNPVGVDRSDPSGADDVVTMNQLHLPVNRDVIIHLGSKDVIHSLAIRQMRVCQDAIPGMSIPLWFKPTVTTDEMRKKMGDDKFDYEIMCAQLCGLGHYRMRGFVTVESQEQYDAWIADQAKQVQDAAASGGGSEYE